MIKYIIQTYFYNRIDVEKDNTNNYTFLKVFILKKELKKSELLKKFIKRNLIKQNSINISGK